jgi:tripartite-type tricarboxylate transporter receptor subunit TctC
MKLPHRRQFLHLAAGAVALPAISRFARAQDYPSRPVRVIVSVAPGGANDLVARLMGQWLSERLGQQFVIENRPGAGGNIGTEAVVNSPPDGYTLLLVGSFNAINTTLYDKLNFNFIRDIAPVAGIIRVPLVVVVNPSVPAKTAPEFIAYAKANSGKINYGSAGIGTSLHVGWRSLPRHGRRRCRRSQPWQNLYRATRRVLGSASAHLRTRSLRISTDSTN